MNFPGSELPRSPLAALRQLVPKPRERREFCELCAKTLGPMHQHVLELDKRSVLCACDACAILFDGNGRQRYRRIPRDARLLKNFAMDDYEWESLLIPINLAFFVHNSSAGRVIAQYPSPGGAMESSLDLEYWNVIADHNPIVKTFEPDVEALLVNRISTPPQYYRAPIDQCFRLVGIIRTQWRGLSGGTDVWNEIDRFFQELKLACDGVQHA
ncbi:MAG TPA: DUF5947 family protein [Candidatus Sulfotelmatobacter sp.]